MKSTQLEHGCEQGMWTCASFAKASLYIAGPARRRAFADQGSHHHGLPRGGVSAIGPFLALATDRAWLNKTLCCLFLSAL